MNNRQMMLVGFSAILFLGVAIVWWLISPSWTPLFSYSLADESQREILDVLGRNEIEFRIDPAKNSIQVKSVNLNKAHKLLADNDLPKESSSGLEMFNNSDYGLSEFAQNINYQRGMEEELARTIMRVQGIRSARVHLTIKKDSLFEDRKQEPKASVVIGFKDSFIFEQSKIRGIQEVLAAAIPNLQIKNIAVITDKGEILSNTGEDDLNIKNNFLEHKYRALLVNLLDGAIGQENFKLSVNIRINNKKKVTIEENYYPEMSTGKGFVVKKRAITSSDDSSLSSKPNNIHSTIEEEYVYSKEKSEITFPIGEVEQITVGLVIKSANKNITSQLKNLIETTLAMDSDRGDRISIVVAENEINEEIVPPIVDSLPLENKSSEKKENYLLIWFTVVLGGLILIAALTLFFIRGKKNRALSESERDVMAKEIIQWLQ